MRTPTVAVLTFCREREHVFGNTLVFQSIRRAFPTAQIQVWDNASTWECWEEIRDATYKLGDVYLERLPHRVLHADWIEERVREAAREDRPLVIVDPDVVFWEQVEDVFAFPAGTLMAGR